MASRQFFRKARNVVHPPKPPARPKAPDHYQKVVMAVRLSGAGTPEHKTMSSRKAAQVLGGQKGGLKSSGNGTAHRWNAESARKAAIRSWTKRRKFNKRIGARVGMVSKRRASLWREPLRLYYAEHPTRGISYDPSEKQWRRFVPNTFWHRPISERAALTALGHLKSSGGYIPDSITPVINRHSKRS